MFIVIMIVMIMIIIPIILQDLHLPLFAIIPLKIALTCHRPAPHDTYVTSHQMLHLRTIEYLTKKALTCHRLIYALTCHRPAPPTSPQSSTSSAPPTLPVANI